MSIQGIEGFFRQNEELFALRDCGNYLEEIGLQLMWVLGWMSGYEI